MIPWTLVSLQLLPGKERCFIIETVFFDTLFYEKVKFYYKPIFKYNLIYSLNVDAFNPCNCDGILEWT